MSYSQNSDVFLRINDQDSRYLKEIENKNKLESYITDPLYVENIFQRIDINVKLPLYEHEDDSGMDVRAFIPDSIELVPHIPEYIATGLVVKALPKNTEIQVRSRSGLASRANIVANSPGTIDEGYRGEIKIILINIGVNNYIVNNGDRIAQLVLAPVLKAKMPLEREFKVRGKQGFGSTGVK